MSKLVNSVISDGILYILIFCTKSIMGLLSKYSGKRLLITGATGFVGKVLLQKFLYSLSSVDKIYLFIRVKQGVNLQERFTNQIVNSPCLNRLRILHKSKFDDFIARKVQIIEGDLLMDNLGLSESVQKELIEKCNVIINCAASIDFNARLDQSIESNIYGPIKMLNLAKRMKNLEIFTHISTAYANSDMRGLVRQEIYDKDKDPQDQLKYLNSLTLKQLVENTKNIVGKFPNTYTFTKNLCQRLLNKRRGEIPVCIIRPSIINTSYIEPFPGWIDNIAAAAALYMMVGLGIVHQVRGDQKKLVDTVPVDYTVSTIIVATAYNMNQNRLKIYHSAITDRNPFVMGKIKDLVVKFWNQNQVKNKFQKAYLCYSENQMKIKMSKMKRLPVQIYCRLGPLLGSKHKKNASKIKKTMAIGDKVASIFQYFLRNEWIFQCKNFYQLWDFIDVQDRKQFLIDVTQIDFVKYIQLNNYGIQYYVLKENSEIPINNQNLLILQGQGQKTLFSDIKWVCNYQFSQNKISNAETFKNKIHSSKEVQKSIKAEIEKRKQDFHTEEKTILRQINTQSNQILHSIVGNVKIANVKAMTWTLHKFFNKIYQRININTKMIQEIRQIQKKDNTIPFIFLPSGRSYFDFLLINYISVVYKLKLPLLIHNQNTIKSSILNLFAKKYGSISFDKVKYQKSTLYKSIFNSYIELLLEQGNSLQFFIESANQRFINPQIQILNLVSNTLLTGKIQQVCIVPITINYQKIFDYQTFSNEIFGKKQQESLIKFAEKITKNFGKVYVEICKPIMGRNFIQMHKNRQMNENETCSKQFALKSLQKQIICRMSNGLVLVITSIVSSVLLMYKKGINKDLLIRFVTDIIRISLKKGYRIGGINQHSPAVAISNCFDYLGNIIQKNKNIYSISVEKGKFSQKFSILAHYRNTLMQVFLPQAFIGCVLSAFGDLMNSQQTNLSKIHEKTKFLILLLSEQYYTKYSLEAFNDFMQIVQQMQENEIIQFIQDKIVICKSGIRMIPFYSSLLRFQIQAYWSCLVYIITIARNHHKHEISSFDSFFDTIQWFIKTLYDEKVIEEYEACSKKLISNALQKLQKEKLIKMLGGGKKKKAYIQILVSIEQLQNLESNIKFFLQNSLQSSAIQFAKSSMKQLAKL